MDKEQDMLTARVLQGQGKTQSEIAQELGVCERTVRNYLKQLPRPRRKPVRGSRVDPYKGIIDSILEQNPSYNGELIFERIQKLGYSGKISVMKDYVAAVRRKLAAQAVIRFETEPGRQAQVDWKEFGVCTVDGVERKLYAFVMVLGYSRLPFIRFTTSMDQATLLACHILAFRSFGGVSAEILYDNMRTAFACGSDGRWKPTRRLLAFASHYGFTPLRCRVRRPETKGKVERTVGYLDNNFWPRMEGVALSLDQLNRDVADWVSVAAVKPMRELLASRAERFAQERPLLLPMREADFDVREAVPLKVDREARVTYQTNRYSVPAEHIGAMLCLLVHPLHRQAELTLPGGESRRFTLAASGARRTIDFPGDQERLARRWAKDRALASIWRAPKKRRPATETEVDIRSPSVYESLAGAAGGAV